MITLVGNASSRYVNRIIFPSQSSPVLYIGSIFKIDVTYCEIQISVEEPYEPKIMIRWFGENKAVKKPVDIFFYPEIVVIVVGEEHYIRKEI
jgi:hypothetical protein